MELVNLLKNRYNIVFNNLELLKKAFTHSSYSNENRKDFSQNNERLEFLGDAVLELVVSNYLFRKYPNMAEGDLSRLRSSIVCEDSLSELAKKCEFDKYILLGRGEENANARNRSSLLCDLFEAFLGALYLDQGLSKVTEFLDIVMLTKIENGDFDIVTDYKTHLQELLQQRGKVSIEYKLVKEEGPAHNREFYVEVYFEGEQIGEGQGKSKKQAEQAAAKEAIKKFDKTGEKIK